MIIKAKFAGRCNRCGNAIAIDDQIVWERNVRGASHLMCPVVAVNLTPAQPVTPVTPVVRGNVDQSLILNFLTAAHARGLKAPKVRFLAPDGKNELRLSLAGSTSKYPGAIQVKIGYDWQGRINADGTVVGSRIDAAMLATLNKIALNPAQAAKEYGALMGRCSFCGLELTDAGSVEVGYGPICARNYNLPHNPKGTTKVSIVGAIIAEPIAPVPTTRFQTIAEPDTEDFSFSSLPTLLETEL